VLAEVGILITLAIAVTFAVRLFAIDIAGDSDSYGYVSEAVRLSQGHFFESEHVFAPFGLPENSALTFPLGYTPHGTTGTVPTYPFGYPLLMAVMIRLFGVGAAYWVSAILAAGTVTATYAAGRAQLGRFGGALAAGLCVILPNFLWDAIIPMSDVPATFFAAVGLAAILWPRQRAGNDLVLGAATGFATWVRPNLILLTIPIVLYLAWRREWMRAAGFGLGFLPFVGIEIVVNQRLYGSPVVTGYGTLPFASSLPDVAARALRFVERLNDQQAGVGLVLVYTGLIVGKLNKEHRTLLFGFGAVLLAFFAFYAIDDAWWYGRFLLPGLPAIAVLEASVVVRAIENGRFRFLRIGLILVGLFWFGWSSIGFSLTHDVFTRADGELRYIRAANLGRVLIEQPALVLSMQHSGTLRYYAGIPTARYDNGSPTDLVATVQQVTQRGGTVYLVGDTGEVNHIRDSDRSFLLVGATQLGIVEPLSVVVLQLRPPTLPLDASIPRQLQVSFGGQIELLGYDVSSDAIAARRALTLTVYWHALKIPDHNYTVFVHILDGTDTKVAQSDSYPVSGQFPTSTWKPDYVVKDTHQMQIPVSANGGSLKIILGLYRNETGERLQPFADARLLPTDFLPLTTLD
jgi:hypothetical protein